jgi:hypothetical protein
MMALLAMSAMINAAATGTAVSAAGGPVSATEDAAPIIATAHRRTICVVKEPDLDRTTTPASFMYKVCFAGKSQYLSLPEKEEFTLSNAVHEILHITGLSEQDKAFARTALEAARNPELYESEYTSLVEQLTKESADEVTIESAISTLEEKYEEKKNGLFNERLAKYFDFKMFKGKLKIRFTEDPCCSVNASGTLCRGYTISLDGKSVRATVYGEIERATHPTLLGAVGQ